MRLLSIVIQYIYQLLYSRIKLIEWTNLNKMEDKIFRLRMRPIIPMKIRLTFPLLHKQVNIFTYLGRLTLVYTRMIRLHDQELFFCLRKILNTVQNVKKNVRERSHSRVCSWTVGHFVNCSQCLRLQTVLIHLCSQ